MSDETKAVTVHCPKCGSERIGEWNVSYALLDVWEWELDGGVPIPSDIDTGVDADWEIDDRRDQYECRNCQWRGSPDELAVKDAPQEPAA